MASRKTTKRAPTKKSSSDAVSLLKADHRQVEQWFEAFEKTRSDARKLELAQENL